MNTERESQSYRELVASSIELVERELPDLWSRVIDHELGKRVLNRAEGVVRQRALSASRRGSFRP
jgi:hypothetical protein